MSDQENDETEPTEDAVMRTLFVLTLTLVLMGLAYFIALGLLHR